MKAKKKNRAATTKASREERLQIMLHEGELRAVDNFRYQNRMPSRAAAVRELFRLGLAAALGKLGSVAGEGQKSNEYGVLPMSTPPADR